MKIALLTVLFSVGMMTSYPLLAAACSATPAACQGSCTPPTPGLSCACTDPGVEHTTCLSKDTYCDAFGNVGGLEP